MCSDFAIRVKGLGKRYFFHQRPLNRFLKKVWPRGDRFAEEIWALREFEMEVKPGQTVGIIGPNGSGKSTLLQLICGTTMPTEGEIEVNGRISALLELGAGFNPDFTGRENVFLNAALLGLSRKEIERKYDEIVEFAEVREFINLPVKTYSSGNYVKLAFAVAINVNPAILVVDEALSVGDARFQQKCIARIKQLRERGVSILFVSHDLAAVRQLCDEVIILHDGREVKRGIPFHMTNWYLAFLTVDYDLARMRHLEAAAERSSQRPPIPEEGNVGQSAPTNRRGQTLGPPDQTTPAPPSDGPAGEMPGNELVYQYLRHGDGNARILETLVTNSCGQSVETVWLGDKIELSILVEFLSNQTDYLIGFQLKDRLGDEIISINTIQEKVELPPISAGEKLLVTFAFSVHIKPGMYSVTSAVAYDQYRLQWMDWVESALTLSVLDPVAGRIVFGVHLPPERRVEFKKIP